MSYPNARTALELRLKNGWGTTTPIKWQNVRFDAPVDKNSNPLPYIAFILRSGVGEDITLGSDNPWQRWTGIVVIQIFTLENTGMKLATQYAETIKNIYLTQPRQISYLSSGIIRLFAPYATEVGNVSGYYQTNVTIPFKRDAQL